jgi:hypothetical protein
VIKRADRKSFCQRPREPPGQNASGVNHVALTTMVYRTFNIIH